MRRALDALQVILGLALAALFIIALSGHAGNQREGSAIPWLAGAAVIVALSVVVWIGRNRRYPTTRANHHEHHERPQQGAPSFPTYQPQGPPHGARCRSRRND